MSRVHESLTSIPRLQIDKKGFQKEVKEKDRPQKRIRGIHSYDSDQLKLDLRGLKCLFFFKENNKGSLVAAERDKSWINFLQDEWKTESEDTVTIPSAILEDTSPRHYC